MSVKELIMKLLDYPPDTLVTVEDNDSARVPSPDYFISVFTQKGCVSL